ncbi:hypothetical protein RchiOBHm_Chr4g0387001 [Rosa chinensis]|uniref:Uncharacterized protein n=1 Tax=Rosa chinensis TaxID=74649 RepID=A0A2P6QPC2_ROSCH|nr:hypothetical protein RchiOBHm_Chr4g0387001 [Rosa chinensis]
MKLGVARPKDSAKALQPWSMGLQCFYENMKGIEVEVQHSFHRYKMTFRTLTLL